MKLKDLICFVFIFSYSSFAQEEYNLSGYIIDSETGETLIGANIYITSSKQGASSNSYGYFSINIKPQKDTIICSYIGYETDSLKINPTSNLNHDFKLKPTSNKLEEIMLNSKNLDIKSVQGSVINLPVKEVKKIPALLGEKDVLKSIQLLPGVQSGSEGTSGFYVRGGGPDQNLILLDGVNIYHASHLLGFFSVFNDDAIKNINLIKGGYPARFGGRLSSVLEIDMKDGNMKKWEIDGGIGLISGKITIQGPIKKDTTSILISARRTWLDLLREPIVKALEDKIDFSGNGNYYFYDVNAKINHKFSNKDRIYLSFYSGKDDFFGKLTGDENGSWEDGSWAWNYTTKFGLSWQNIITSIRWNHIVNSKIFTNTTILYSRYNFDNIIQTNNETNTTYNNQEEITLIENSDYLYRSGIEDVGIKFDVDYSLNSKHYIKFGFSYIKHNFFPGYMDFFADYEEFSADTTIVFSDPIKPNNYAIYFEDLYTVNNRLSINTGIHYSIFNVNNKTYQSPQPRLSIRYMLNETSSIKCSYASMQQNIHLLANSSFGLPNDMWVPATETVGPQFSKQVAIGYHKYFRNKIYQLSLEAYYKTMEDLITFSEGTNILGTNFSSWEERIEDNGLGNSKGIEIFVKKNTGKFTGWIGYTLSNSTRQFENINLGNAYPYKFNRIHDLSITSSYEIKKGVTAHATWIYGTGNSITIPIAQYLLLTGNDFVEYFDYGEKNSFTMAPYHRLDVGVNFIKQKKWGERTWTISIYNVYNRKNPFFIYLQENGDNGDLEYSTYQPMQISLFPIIPSIRYSFKF
tara:strand:- start:5933 stop:8341 length:2409 start_codon:yes stop_codon:yes gene_type:complete